MQYEVRTAQLSDLPRILEIYAYARKFMAEHGNPTQWGTNKPGEAQLRQDMEQLRLQVVVSAEQIHGVFYFYIGEDPTYGRIRNGECLTDAPYVTIHRVSADGSGGVFGACLQWCLGQTKHLRIDTHANNLVMQHVIEKNGFSRRGIILWKTVQNGSLTSGYKK